MRPFNSIDAIRQASEDYTKAKEYGLTNINRWEEGIEHHPKSERLVRFLAHHDFRDYDDHFCWKVGGDGDNGEALMYQLDAFYEMLDKVHEENFKETNNILFGILLVLMFILIVIGILGYFGIVN